MGYKKSGIEEVKDRDYALSMMTEIHPFHGLSKMAYGLVFQGVEVAILTSSQNA